MKTTTGYGALRKPNAQQGYAGGGLLDSIKSTLGIGQSKSAPAPAPVPTPAPAAAPPANQPTNIGTSAIGNYNANTALAPRLAAAEKEAGFKAGGAIKGPGGAMRPSPVKITVAIQHPALPGSVPGMPAKAPPMPMVLPANKPTTAKPTATMGMACGGAIRKMASGGAVAQKKSEHGAKLKGPGTPTSDSIPAKVVDTGEPIRVATGERIVSHKQDAFLEGQAKAAGYPSVDAWLEAGTGHPVGPTIKYSGKKMADGGEIDSPDGVNADDQDTVTTMKCGGAIRKKGYADGGQVDPVAQLAAQNAAIRASQQAQRQAAIASNPITNIVASVPRGAIRPPPTAAQTVDGATVNTDGLTTAPAVKPAPTAQVVRPSPVQPQSQPGIADNTIGVAKAVGDDIGADWKAGNYSGVAGKVLRGIPAVALATSADAYGAIGGALRPAANALNNALTGQDISTAAAAPQGATAVPAPAAPTIPATAPQMGPPSSLAEPQTVALPASQVAVAGGALPKPTGSVITRVGNSYSGAPNIRGDVSIVDPTGAQVPRPPVTDQNNQAANALAAKYGQKRGFDPIGGGTTPTFKHGGAIRKKSYADGGAVGPSVRTPAMQAAIDYANKFAAGQPTASPIPADAPPIVNAVAIRPPADYSVAQELKPATTSPTDSVDPSTASVAPQDKPAAPVALDASQVQAANPTAAPEQSTAPATASAPNTAATTSTPADSGPSVSVVPGMSQALINQTLTNPDGSRWTAKDNAIMAANIQAGRDPYADTSQAPKSVPVSMREYLASLPVKAEMRGQDITAATAAGQQQILQQQRDDQARHAAAMEGIEANKAQMQYDPFHLNSGTSGPAVTPGSIPGGASAGAPLQAAMDAGPTGQDFLKSLPPNLASTVKGLAEGRLAFPNGAALKNPLWNQMLAAVAQYDPSFDAVNYKTRADTRRDFTSGKAASSVNALNTVMGHLDTLGTNVDALNNTRFPMVNSALNSLSSATGDPRVVQFGATKKAVVDELTRAWRGSGGSEGDIKSWSGALDAANSPQQLHGVISQIGDLLESKIGALNDQYNKGMGTTAAGLNLMSPHAQQSLDRIRTRADGQQVAAQPTAQAAPAAVSPQLAELQRRAANDPAIAQRLKAMGY